MAKTSKNQSSRISELVKEILHHQYLYYNATPEITDSEYDLLMDELTQLDPKHPVLQLVGQDASVQFAKVRHVIPMNSQGKASQSEEFLKWTQKMGYREYIVQHKLDGISVELQYVGGTFIRAVSRGDGIIGDNITANVMNMEGVPITVEPEFSGAIRGEILMDHRTFSAKYSDQKNCRNTSAGITKRKDGEGSSDLTIICYDVMNMADPFVDEKAKLEWLEENEFTVVDTHTYTDPIEIVKYRNSLTPIVRAALPFDIDGLVVKSNIIDWEDMKRDKPNKQIAFKFPPTEQITTLREVEWSQAGNTLTPVAIVDPVELAGTTVQRASLANPGLIQELGIFIGSSVVITKRGEIIPKIERVVKTPDNTSSIPIPIICPTCKSELINLQTRLYCPNELCPAKELHRLRKWITVLNIKNFGEKLIEALYSRGKVKQIADLYTLTVQNIMEIPRQGEKSAEKALNNLYEVKEISLAKFIGGFDIEGVGETLMEPIVDAGFDSLEKIRDAEITDLMKIEGYGEINSDFIIQGVKNMYDPMQAVLATSKIRLTKLKKVESLKLSGISLCFTGKLNTMSRGDAKDLVSQHGGKFTTAISGNVNYLVTNTPHSGTSKNQKAQNLGISIITEQEFLDLISS
ncbi:MAG: NAD-dependent DNA ligase LigA [Promethearchaeota archaeon]